MTSYYPVTPSNKAAPTVQVTLDGGLYTLACLWSIYGQRYYVQCASQSGAVIFLLPLVETAPAVPVSSASWLEATGLVTFVTATPLPFPIGSVVNLTISGCSPVAYNGLVACSMLNSTTFTYPLASDPGIFSLPGSVSFLLNLAAGYFVTSTLIFRNGQFEVTP
jgi:hypothetical protein